MSIKQGGFFLDWNDPQGNHLASINRDGTFDAVGINFSDGTSMTTAASGGGTPGGSNGQIQFNNNGAFGGITSYSLNGPGILDSSLPAWAQDYFSQSSNPAAIQLETGNNTGFGVTIWSDFCSGITTFAIAKTDGTAAFGISAAAYGNTDTAVGGSFGIGVQPNKKTVNLRAIQANSPDFSLIGSSAAENVGLYVFNQGSSGKIDHVYGIRIAAQTAGNSDTRALAIEDQGATQIALEVQGGRIIFSQLPTSSAGLPSGALWNSGGTVKIV